MEILPVVATDLSVPETLSPKEQRMEKAGATREAAYKTVVAGLTADVMTLDKYGDEHIAPDNSTRLRAAEMILKMRGDIRPETLVDNRTVTISGVPAEAVRELVSMVADVASQLASLKSSGRQTGEVIDVEATSG